MALLQTMAGHVPAIRISTPIFAFVYVGCLATVSSSAIAQMDQLTRGRMQYLHRSLVIAEENLSLAMRDRDVSRARLVNDLLFNLASDTHERKLSGNPCLDALESLSGVAVSVGFVVHPITTGSVSQMTREELRFSDQMRPADDTLDKWFGDYSAAYRSKISDCEQEIGATSTSRSLPDRLLRK
jgi:hypothetical protein